MLLRSLGEPLETRASPRVEVSACALIDVVGFTQKAESMAALGPQAPEALSRLVNQTFDPLVAKVQAAGGEVLRFPGDAMIVLWPAGPEDEGLAAQRAAACCLDLVAGREEGALPLSCGVALGPLTSGTAGGVLGRTEHVVTGPALGEMGAAQGRAREGEVVLGPSVWAQLVGCAGLEAVDAHGFRRLRACPVPTAPLRAAAPPRGEIDEGALRSYLPRALLKRLEAWGEHWLSEVRPVSVLFIRLVPLEGAPPLDLPQIHTTLCGVQRVVYRYEGALDKLNLDEKGISVLAAMGLPPFAHEDDPLRAVLAGQRLETELRASGIRADIGVCTGRAICGPIGGSARREYSMLGQVVNRAARLMQAGEGVLCDRSTMEAAGALSLRPAGSRELKGFFEPVEVFRAAGLGRGLQAGEPPEAARDPDVAPPPPTLVGRREERRLLRGLLDDLAQGLGGAVVLTGTAGVGKTALVQTFVAEARTRGASVWTVQADPHRRHVPFGTVASLYRALLADPHVLWVATQTPERAALLADLVGDALVPPELDPPVDGDARRESTIDALLEVTEAALAEWPALQILVAEELHWFDSASLTWLERLASRLEVLGTGLVATSRSRGSEHPRVERLLERPRTISLPVEGLEAADLEDLVLDLLGASEADPALLDLVTARVGGNPLFCRELIKALVGRGLVTVDDRGRARLLDHERAAAVLPDSLLAAVAAPLDRLDLDLQMTLKAASVLGHVFDPTLLEVIHPGSPGSTGLQDQFEALQREAVLIPEGSSSRTRLRFRHAVVHQAIYGRMLQEQRRELHSAAFETLSALPRTPPALLAQHAWAAGRVEEALDWTGPAAEAAARSGSYREVQGLLRERVSLLPRGDARGPGWLVLMGRSSVALGDHVAARRFLHGALRALGRRVPEGRVGHLWAILEQVLVHLWRRVGSDPPASGAEVSIAARAYEELGYVHYASGETAPGVLAAVAMLNLWDRVGPSAGQVRARSSAALAMAILGFERLSRFYEASAFDIAAGIDLPRSYAFVGWVAAICAAGRAEWTRLEKMGRMARSAAEAMGDRWLTSAALQTLAAGRVLRGDLQGATDAAMAQFRIAEEQQNVLWEAWALNALGEVSLRSQDPALALQHAEGALAHLEQVADPTEQVRALAVLARAHLALGAPGRAGAAAARIAAGLETTGPTAFYLAGALTALVETERASGRSGRGALRRLRRFARVFPVARPDLERLAGARPTG